jgi:hypothetical protein
MTENEQLIDLVGRQTTLLLKNHWPDIQEYLDGDEIKIGFNHRLTYDSDHGATVETTISFSRRVKDSISESINTAQANLPLKVTIEKREDKK